MMARMLGLRLACVCAAANCAVAASAAQLPLYPVDANCREATGFFFRGSQLAPARKADFEQRCIDVQQDAYEKVASLWPSLGDKDQQACLHLVQTQNYILLARCAADLRAQEVGSGPRQAFHP